MDVPYLTSRLPWERFRVALTVDGRPGPVGTLDRWTDDGEGRFETEARFGPLVSGVVADGAVLLDGDTVASTHRFDGTVTVPAGGRLSLLWVEPFTDEPCDG